ncbi:DUF4381 domain-containing protein [Mariprofundus sp. EBB-1]|uniref:DUF4381 domain-containing protein n=1 Tax=Mariprofundus sp. EBB-1 TaxID=2650971 RepID=UPI00137B5A0A|nr:DUF4381 domain-containing protein [Mariprofundus sp. EBB-1]
MNGQMNSGADTDPLAQLRDIHLPDAISWWPLAPGWWMLFALILIIIAALFYYLRWRDIQKNKPIIFSTQQVMQAALLELTNIEKVHAETEALSDGQARQIVADISQLLRRCAVQLTQIDNNPNSVAGLTGDAWLSWLDERWDRHDFMQGVGRILIDAPYQNGFSQNDTLIELLTLCRDWLEQQA